MPERLRDDQLVAVRVERQPVREVEPLADLRERSVGSERADVADRVLPGAAGTGEDERPGRAEGEVVRCPDRLAVDRVDDRLPLERPGIEPSYRVLLAVTDERPPLLVERDGTRAAVRQVTLESAGGPVHESTADDLDTPQVVQREQDDLRAVDVPDAAVDGLRYRRHPTLSPRVLDRRSTVLPWVEEYIVGVLRRYRYKIFPRRVRPVGRRRPAARGRDRRCLRTTRDCGSGSVAAASLPRTTFTDALILDLPNVDCYIVSWFRV
jgi:hypothetical protein